MVSTICRRGISSAAVLASASLCIVSLHRTMKSVPPSFQTLCRFYQKTRSCIHSPVLEVLHIRKANRDHQARRL